MVSRGDGCIIAHHTIPVARNGQALGSSRGATSVQQQARVDDGLPGSQLDGELPRHVATTCAWHKLT